MPVVDVYPSYINRVFGLRDSDDNEFVVKFYRPRRWSRDAVEEEHSFLKELSHADIPVVLPLPDSDGDTLGEIILEDGSEEHLFRFALFPKRSGRLFDSESEDAWLRIGALCGRMHNVAAKHSSRHRVRISPAESFAEHVRIILSVPDIPPDIREELKDLLDSVRDVLVPLFEDVPSQRLHGDLHRGNILDRGDEGLLLIDLDDMAQGPAVQDLWLALPGRYGEVGRETALLAEGYESFRPFPWDQLQLMEPLRFMRMIHFIAWCAAQREDQDFSSHFPDWGSRGWWIREMEDLREQTLTVCRPGGSD